mmetsp:Transcript_59728/g.106584  ORF Transcript_59728/g.106584 Transcript_59728/m.106584 type:complete len:123 (+) Transcript_59728:116-484(+)
MRMGKNNCTNMHTCHTRTGCVCALQEPYRFRNTYLLPVQRQCPAALCFFATAFQSACLKWRAAPPIGSLHWTLAVPTTSPARMVTISEPTTLNALVALAAACLRTPCGTPREVGTLRLAHVN